MSIIDIFGLMQTFVRSHTQSGGVAGEEEGEEPGSGCGKRPRPSLHPVPRFVSASEQHVVEASLHRWAEEMEQDMAGGPRSRAHRRA